VNFVTAHDGFTLADLLSYARKHNLANGEGNRDGHDHNHSINCGVEGPSDDPQVLARRRDLGRALLTTLLVSQGTPMLLAGDELGHSLGGNNNAYCQDNEISWIDWTNIDEALLEFVKQLIALRRNHPALRQDRWLGPHPRPNAGRPVEWLRPDGAAMGVEDWHARDARALMVHVGEPEDPLLLLFNAEAVSVEFAPPDGPWTVALASAEGHRRADERVIVPAHAVVIMARAQ
ncbi:MAG: glycogen debranching enzyme GlgX, partial [Enhygromyxa sp.]